MDSKKLIQIILAIKTGSDISFDESKGSGFTFLTEKVIATSVNLSVQSRGLKEIEYVETTKQLNENYSQINFKIFHQGILSY